MDIQKLIDSGILEKYVLGLADPEEMDTVERLTREYPEVNRHICKMQNCIDEYAEMDAIRPPKRSDNAGPAKVKTGFSALSKSLKWGAGIGALCIIGLFVLSLMFYQNSEAALMEISVLSAQVKNLKSSQKTLEQDNEYLQEQHSVLTDISTKQVHLRNLDNQIHAVVYLNAKHNKCFIDVLDLPKCPRGNDYQVWASVQGEHVNLGLLNKNTSDKKLYNMPYIEDCEGFVITLEKSGGNLIPTVENMYAYASM